MNTENNLEKKRAELEALVQPITDHVQECVNWWRENLPNTKEIIVIMNDNGTSLKIRRPDLEVCSVQSHLPFCIDFEQLDLINITE